MGGTGRKARSRGKDDGPAGTYAFHRSSEGVGTEGKKKRKLVRSERENVITLGQNPEKTRQLHARAERSKSISGESAHCKASQQLLG